MFKKLGKKKDFSRSYDDKRGQKSQQNHKKSKKSTSIKNFVSIFFFNFKFLFFMKVLKIKFNKKKFTTI